MGAIVLALQLVVPCGDLCRDEALAHYARLFAEAGYGRMPHERAGFLIRETDGTLTFAPFTESDFARASYRGGIPANTIAVVHTHPTSMSPMPSAHDVAEARRIGLPVLVVTQDAITAAHIDGSRSVLLRGWLRNAERTPARASETVRAPRARRTALRR